MKGGSVLWPALLALIVLSAGAAAGQRGGEQRKQVRPSVFTGCLDQDGEDYLLREPSNLSETAVIEPEGFAKDGLAKYVGHTVRVRGSRISEAGKAKLRARSVEMIAEGCSPAKVQ